MFEYKGSDQTTGQRWFNSLCSHKVVCHKNLRQASTEAVRDRILSWSRQRDHAVVDPENPDENPFYYCPVVVRQDVLDSILLLRPNGMELLNICSLLLCRGITRFDLTCLNDCKYTDVGNIISLLIKHGSVLRELVVGGGWMFYPGGKEAMIQLLSSVPNLESLTVQRLIKNGRELFTIAQYCKRLRTLKIPFNSLSDEEIEEFLAVLDPSKPLVKTLRSLNTPMSVKMESVVKLLFALPEIESLQTDAIEDLLIKVNEEPENTKLCERIQELKCLYANLPLRWDSCSIMSQNCPNLVTLSLVVHELMDLSPLGKLKNLLNLSLENSPTLGISFVEDIVPVLKECGSNLLSLKLRCFDMVDVAFLSVSCPNIVSLCLDWFVLLGIGKESSPFKDLQKLFLRGVGDRANISPIVYNLLLSKCQNIRDIELFRSYSLDDQVVSTLVQTNSFNELETLFLHHGHGITPQGLRNLTRYASKLRYWSVF